MKSSKNSKKSTSKPKTPTIGYCQVKPEDEPRQYFHGYNIYGKKVKKYLEKYESFSDEHCPVCNSIMVTCNDGPYPITYCMICGNPYTSDSFKDKDVIKKLKKDIVMLVGIIEEYHNKLDTLLNLNNVRTLNSKELPKIEKIKKI